MRPAYALAVAPSRAVVMAESDPADLAEADATIDTLAEVAGDEDRDVQPVIAGRVQRRERQGSAVAPAAHRLLGRDGVDPGDPRAREQAGDGDQVTVQSSRRTGASEADVPAASRTKVAPNGLGP